MYDGERRKANTMASIHDYLYWRADLTFADRPFNDVDNLILSCLSYLDFMDIVPTEEQGKGIPLSLACERFLKRANGNIGPYVRSLAKISIEFVELLAQTERFGSARLTAYKDIVDNKRSLQFAALCIELPFEGTYVAFRGTDTSLVGWRENLMLSYTVTQAQHEAVSYLERAVSRIEDSNAPIRVGGHSKGGNLAEYAVAFCPERVRERVRCVYSNDGPGMAPEVLPEDIRAMLGDRLRRIIPTSSVIGMLFAREHDRHVIVASSATGLEQHDLTTWQVSRDGIIEAPKLLPDCEPINDAIATWVNSIPLDEREQASNEIFDALESAGAITIDQVVDSPERLQRTIRALRSTNERTREVAMALVQLLINKSVNAMRSSVMKTFEDASRKFLE